MSTNGNPHPGRSVDFLSRLHDGDLSPGERARFEAHRAHCTECRRAAIEFEDALAMFRSARSTPPRTDLAARILRKVQSTNRPRVPFPLGFRIDLGWATLLATALVALLITTPIRVRRPEGSSPLPAPAPAPAPEAKSSADDGFPAPSEARPAEPRQRSADAKPDAGRGATNERKEEVPPSIAAAVPSSPAESRGAAQSSRETSAAAPAIAGDERRAVAIAPETGRIGGEGGTVSPLARAAPLKLRIEPIDGFGPAPVLVSRSLPFAAVAVGREFVVLVDAQGGVRNVSARPARDERSLEELSAESNGGDEVAATIANLRFAPGNRPRRLLVRVE